MASSNQTTVTAQAEAAKKLPYCAPRLTRYGDLATLTQSGVSQASFETGTFRPSST